MKTKLHAILAFTILGSIMMSCGTSNDVTSNRSIQKRKYRKGFFVDFDKKWGGKSQQQEEVAEVEQSPVDASEEVISGSVESTPNSEVFTAEQPENGSTIAASENGDVANTPIEETEKSEVTVPVAQQDVQQDRKRPTRLKDRLNKIKQTKAVIKQKLGAPAAGGGLLVVLLVILALILPPLAVLIFEGVTGRFWLNLLFWLIGIGVGAVFFTGGIIYLFALIAVIHAILIVVGAI